MCLDEIIDATKKLDNLKKAVKEGSLKSEKPKLARVSTDFMRTLRPTVSLRSENGEFIDDDYVPDDTTAIDVRDILLQASGTCGRRVSLTPIPKFQTTR